MFESAALCLHLADRHPEAGLIGPLGSHERALQYQWCFFAMTELEVPLVDIARELWKDEGEPDAARIDDRRARFENGVGVIEAALAGGEYLVGDRFTVADIVVGGVLSFARTAEIADLPTAIVPYVDGLEARPARRRAYTRTA